ncbi:MAG: radical SAM protein [Candidatus Aminicenantes bacterium]|nr:radical SAM protein [Candidatus Aminicenantes bacterium]
MAKSKNRIELVKALLSNPQILKTKVSINWFLLQYLRKFKPRKVGRYLILHSHLPPVNSKAYTRFINEHLLAKTDGPSHAQIALTNACPQNCEYCYNKDRKGKVMDTAIIKKVIQELKDMGVFWLGFTGGEPLLQKDIVEITESVGDDCAVKLFTTGCTLTQQLAQDLRDAGLFSVSVSLDHWKQEAHDKVRRYAGAFQTALKAIDIFKSLGDVDVGVSAVLSKEMIKSNEVEEFLKFLIGLDIHEAWLSECKPSVQDFWTDDQVITEQERLKLVEIQDRYNREGKITVNYLAHFEGKEHFGCNAGHKMVYIDPFGEVSPCVFIPMTFGNVREESLEKIFKEMKSHFPSEDRCFINRNYKLVQKYFRGTAPLGIQESVKVAEEACFGPRSRFFRLYYK